MVIRKDSFLVYDERIGDIYLGRDIFAVAERIPPTFRKWVPDDYAEQLTLDDRATQIYISNGSESSFHPSTVKRDSDNGKLIKHYLANIGTVYTNSDLDMVISVNHVANNVNALNHFFEFSKYFSFEVGPKRRGHVLRELTPGLGYLDSVERLDVELMVGKVDDRGEQIRQKIFLNL